MANGEFGSAQPPSLDQWMAIADMVSADRELRLGEYTAANGKARVDSKWQEIAFIVNGMPGARKSAEMWRVAFSNKKCHAKAEYKQRYFMKFGGTGAGPEIPAPTGEELGLSLIHAVLQNTRVDIDYWEHRGSQSYAVRKKESRNSGGQSTNTRRTSYFGSASKWRKGHVENSTSSLGSKVNPYSRYGGCGPVGRNNTHELLPKDGTPATDQGLNLFSQGAADRRNDGGMFNQSFRAHHGAESTPPRQRVDPYRRGSMGAGSQSARPPNNGQGPTSYTRDAADRRHDGGMFNQSFRAHNGAEGTPPRQRTDPYRRGSMGAGSPSARPPNNGQGPISYTRDAAGRRHDGGMFNQSIRAHNGAKGTPPRILVDPYRHGSMGAGSPSARPPNNGQGPISYTRDAADRRHDGGMFNQSICAHNGANGTPPRILVDPYRHGSMGAGSPSTRRPNNGQGPTSYTRDAADRHPDGGMFNQSFRAHHAAEPLKRPTLWEMAQLSDSQMEQAVRANLEVQECDENAVNDSQAENGSFISSGDRDSEFKHSSPRGRPSRMFGRTFRENPPSPIKKSPPLSVFQNYSRRLDMDDEAVKETPPNAVGNVSDVEWNRQVIDIFKDVQSGLDSALATALSRLERQMYGKVRNLD